MNKNLKIAGVIFISIIALAVLINIIFSSSQSMLSGSNNFGGSDLMMPESADSSSRSIGFANPIGKNKTAADTFQAEMPAGNVIDKKIIRNGNLSLKVDKVDAAVAKISEIAKNNQGEVFSTNIHQTKNNIKSGTVSVRVPVKNFDKTFSELKPLASLVLSESISGQDVTEEYADLQTQLKNKRAEEEAFLKILNQGGKIEDVLAVTREVSRVRGEIEQIQGRIKFMDSQTDMSTINISLSEDQDITIVDSWRPWQEIKDAFNNLAKNIQGLINFLIKFIIAILPVLFVWALIIWIFYGVGRKIYFKFKK